MSATVYLLPDKLQLIKQICADKNRRISDLISDAVDDYLGKRRNLPSRVSADGKTR